MHGGEVQYGGGFKRLRTEGGKVLSIPAGSEVWGLSERGGLHPDRVR